VSRTPCPICDFPLATVDDLVDDGSLDTEAQERAAFGTLLCWNRWSNDHRGPAIDWRARALRAESALLRSDTEVSR